MTEGAVVEAVVAWIAEVVPAVAANTYTYLPAGKAKGLPDVAVDIVTSEIVREDPDFQMMALQQVVLQVRRLALSFMVESGVTEEQAKAATDTLRSFFDALVAGVLADHTLGGRVALASPFLTVDYEPAFVEYADGTRGREMTVQLAVAEPLQTDD